MQEFAQKDSTTPQGHCPSTEDLAAYIDRQLGESESQRITEHLASCEDCYAAYTKTLRCQLDTESVFSEGEVLPFHVSKEKGTVATALRRWYPIAALLLVGAGTGTFHFLALPPGLVPTKLVPPLANPSSLDGRLWLGPTYRGEGGDEEGKLDEPPFRLGVQLVNLQATLKVGNVPAAQDVVARILGLLKAQPLTDDLYKAYTGITVALEDHKPPSELLPEASRLAKESREIFEPTTALDFGQWVEAGRLAALSRNPSFFQQPDTRSFLRRLYWRDKLGLGDTKLDPLSRESLDQISEIVSKDDLKAADYVALQKQFDKILDKYYPDT